MSPLRRASASNDRAACRIEPFPLAQHQMVDWLGLMHRQHTVHALLEVDVTDGRRAIREHRIEESEFCRFGWWSIRRGTGSTCGSPPSGE